MINQQASFLKNIWNKNQLEPQSGLFLTGFVSNRIFQFLIPLLLSFDSTVLNG
jgi:hypothetical protein